MIDRRKGSTEMVIEEKHSGVKDDRIIHLAFYTLKKRLYDRLDGEKL